MYKPTLAQLDAAAAVVYRAMPPTPQYSWPQLNQALGAETWVKHENHSPLGAFKVRGGLVYMDALTRREPHLTTVMAATRGNHGQSVAYAAARHGVAVRIYVPFGNSVEKNAAMRALGAQLIEVGSDFQACREHAQQVAREEHLHMVPSWHEDLVAGVATGWLELLRAQPDLDLVLVPIGQGSGICAAIAARNALGSKTRVVGVVSSHAPAYQLSFRAGRSISAPVSTVLADGLACRQPDQASLGAILEYADDIIAVTDDEVAHAMRLYYRATHNLAEGAGAAPLAAAMQMHASGALKGRKLGLPLTGGNVDADLFRHVLQGP
ncbi:threonine dehydratase [Massilia sp. CF038]|uniref:threonine dehydratase n=1 Tax=Massilia sp. CF038 TaxID=1881045 RepID=UPI000918A81C|nr:threonine dehydratase [Massilia sp. CF038]SHG58653.1 threonine dehydratase [Massilia sp. CF038]